MVNLEEVFHGEEPAAVDAAQKGRFYMEGQMKTSSSMIHPASGRNRSKDAAIKKTTEKETAKAASFSLAPP